MVASSSKLRIDVHAHYLPLRYMDMLRAAGMKTFSPPHPPALLGQLIAGQEQAGVAVQILSTGPHSPYFQDEAAADACAVEINDSYHQAVASSGGRLAAFGSVPLPHVALATREACRCLDELGFAGIHLGCSTLGRTLDDPGFEPFWEQLNLRAAIIFVHPGGILLGTEPGLAGMSDPLLAVTIGSAAELAGTTLRLIGLRTRFPRLRFILGLLGGVLPLLYERINHFAPVLGKDLLGRYSTRPLRDELREFYYDTTLDDDVQVLRKAREVYGCDRLIFGSDAPAKSPAKNAAFLQSAAFSDAEMNAILSETAAELFRERLRPGTFSRGMTV